jgi:hypothetical protein
LSGGRDFLWRKADFKIIVIDHEPDSSLTCLAFQPLLGQPRRFLLPSREISMSSLATGREEPPLSLFNYNRDNLSPTAARDSGWFWRRWARVAR